MSLHTPLHTETPHVHTLDTHASAPLQVLVQLPQCSASLVRSKQVPLQLVLPVGQTHSELEQIIPPEQGVVHEPQWSASVFGSMHAPLQVIVPVLHTHVPLVQSSPEVHALPHAPQFS